jgi:hypothetical protein
MGRWAWPSAAWLVNGPHRRFALTRLASPRLASPRLASPRAALHEAPACDQSAEQAEQSVTSASCPIRRCACVPTPPRLAHDEASVRARLAQDGRAPPQAQGIARAVALCVPPFRLHALRLSATTSRHACHSDGSGAPGQFLRGPFRIWEHESAKTEFVHRTPGWRTTQTCRTPQTWRTPHTWVAYNALGRRRRSVGWDTQRRTAAAHRTVVSYQ